MSARPVLRSVGAVGQAGLWRPGRQHLGPDALTRTHSSGAGGEDAELVAVGIGEDNPVDIVLAVDGSRAQRHEAVHLRAVVSAGSRHELEVQPVLARRRFHRRTSPRDLGAAVR